MLPIVTRTVEALKTIENDITAIEAAEYELLIMGPARVSSRYADRALCDAAKAGLLAELRDRKDALERDLESYGVTLKAAPLITEAVKA